MPRFGGRGGGVRGARGPSPVARPASPVPRSAPQRDFRTSPQQRFSAPGGQQKFGASGGSKGPGVGTIIAGSFLGSALGSVLGNAISSKMYEGRNPETGAYEDRSRSDSNPCRKELDYFLECAKYVEDPSYCKGPADALKKCADRHKDYFKEPEE